MGTCRPGGGPGAQSDRPLGSVSHDPMTSSLRTESGSLALLFRSGAPVVWPACSSPTGCRRARTPNLPFVPMSVGQVICLGSRLDLSQFLPGTPVSVSRGSLLSPSLLESGSLMDCAVGQTLQILQQCPPDPPAMPTRPSNMHTSMPGRRSEHENQNILCSRECQRIGIFYLGENVRRPITRGQDLLLAPTQVYRREDKRKVWGSWGLCHFCSNSVSFARLLFLPVCVSKILYEQ